MIKPIAFLYYSSGSGNSSSPLSFPLTKDDFGFFDQKYIDNGYLKVTTLFI